ncbi:unnamed protein product [Peronospora belbahrii]|uniref:Uncharacterized protein n=1 Tax=Peronospora belbahrii TaxID=622444 RepID=A0AAU9KQS6_9STRA|nr:unnamed protein product [Peronospora belbahrii]CAH0520043.1 unnamed protein product [Peronospora belbahrii]
MSTTLLEKEVAKDIQQEKQTQQDTEIETHEQEAQENTRLATTKEEEQKTLKESVKDLDTKAKEDNLLVTGTIKKQSEVSKADDTKRKFDALDTCTTAAELTIDHEHQKTKKKARALDLIKTRATKTRNNGNTTKTREFSFARPTESSARRTAALAKNQTQIKATPPPSHKLQQGKRTPAKAPCVSMPVCKTPTATSAADKTSRLHSGYTPYTGPLPPLTVESSFAPKNGQVVDRRAWSVSSAQTKVPAVTRKPRPVSVKKAQQQSTIGKENSSVNAAKDATTNAASSNRTSIKSDQKGIACE